MIIRRATLEDAEAIAKVHVDSWRSTYVNIIPSDYLNHLSYEKRTVLWESNIRDEHNYVVVAVDDNGEIIGFADASKRETNLEEDSCNLTSIYLLRKYQGNGVGRKLLKHLFEHMKQVGYKKVVVEVLEQNNSRYFYEHYGAQLINSVEISISGTVLIELIYEWDNIDTILAKL